MNDNTRKTIGSYDKTVDEYIEYTDTLYSAQEAEKFLSLLPIPEYILDLGCGPGRDAKLFAEKGYNVLGIDLSERMVQKAKERVGSAHFRVMDIRHLDFDAGTFDGVWASASLLHIAKKDLAQALREVFRVLKTGGVFYVSVKEGTGEVLAPDELYGGVEKFWSFYQKSEIENMVEGAGFAILESYVTRQTSAYATHPWIHVFAKKS